MEFHSCYLVFEMGPPIAQAGLKCDNIAEGGLEILILRLHLLSDEIRGMCHHA